MEEATARENPLVDLPRETAQFVRFLYRAAKKERSPQEEGLSDSAVGASRLIESMQSYGWLPEGFDSQRYVEVVQHIEKIEGSLPQTNPSVAVEEYGLAARGMANEAGELAQLHEELRAMDAQLTWRLKASPSEVTQHSNHVDVENHVRTYERDKQEHAAQRERRSSEKHQRIAVNFFYETLGGKQQELPSDIRENITAIQELGFHGDEIAPIPEKGTFQFLEDIKDGVDTPVQAYERQIVRTNRDVTSPDFSGCATVVLYKTDSEGKPEQETIFAHLPPKTTDGFQSYNPSFWQEQTGITDLSEYKAKVVAGLIRSPEEIAHSLQTMGAQVVTMEQIPLEMYRVLVDSRTKSIVAMGELEEVTDNSSEANYRTVDGKLNVKKSSGDIKGLTYIE